MRKTEIAAEPGKQELFITREFDAPRELVFKAFTDPELYVKWVGPKLFTIELETFEPREGGSWRYCAKDTNANAYWFRGVTHALIAPELLIGTFEFEGLPEKGHVCLETARFEAIANNRTRVVIQSVFQSVADRDGMVAAGMESGVVQSHDKLDQLLLRCLEA